MEQDTNEQNQSMEDILKTIRNVISGQPEGEVASNEADVLELTDVVTETSTSTNVIDQPTAEDDHSNDVLNNIDLILNSEKKENELQDNNVTDQPEQAAADEPIPSMEDAMAAAMMADDPMAAAMAQMDQPEPEPEPHVEAAPPPPIQELAPQVVQHVEIPQNIAPAPQEMAQEAAAEEHTRRSLISEENANASAQALKALMKTISRPHTDGLAFRSGTTVEDLVIEILKPQLSEWLNHHLPSLVKHVVEKEIQKLIPRDDD